MHAFVFVGVRTDSKSRAIAYHEWCSRCGTLRSTRLTDGDVLYLTAGSPLGTKDAEQCVAVHVAPEARA